MSQVPPADYQPVTANRYLGEHRTGGGFSCLQLPQGVQLFDPQDRTYSLEIIPYRVPAGAANPFAQDGSLHFERTYYTHRNVGAEQKMQICPAKTYRLPCPICEYKAELNRKEDADEETVKGLAPKERQLWYVYDHGEPEKGLQIFDVSHHNFGKQFFNAVKDGPEDEYWSYFADQAYGSTVRVGFIKDFMGRTEFIKAGHIMCRRRQQQLPQALYDQANAQPLDGMLVARSYEELYKLFYQVDEAPTGPAPGRGPTPAASRPAPPPPTQPGFAGTVPPAPAAAPAPMAPPPAAPPRPAPPVAPPAAAAPVAPPQTPPPAASVPAAAAGPLVKGARVVDPEHGLCEVLKVNGDTVVLLTPADDTVKRPTSTFQQQGAAGTPPQVAPVAPPPVAPVTTASSKGITKGFAFTHPQHGQCSVVKVAPDDIACKVMVDATDDIIQLTAHDIACCIFTQQVVGSSTPKPIGPAPGAALPPAQAAPTVPSPPPAAPEADEPKWDEGWD